MFLLGQGIVTHNFNPDWNSLWVDMVLYSACVLVNAFSRIISHLLSYCFQSKRSLKGKKYAGLLQVWAAMQGTVCGKTSISQENIDKFEKSGNAGMF